MGGGRRDGWTEKGEEEGRGRGEGERERMKLWGGEEGKEEEAKGKEKGRKISDEIKTYMSVNS